MSMNWDCSLIMRTSFVQQNLSLQKTNRNNRIQTSRDIYVFQKNAQNRSVKPKTYQHQKSKQIKKKTSLKNKNSSSTKLINSQAQMEPSKRLFSPYINSLLVSPMCQQNTRPNSRIQTEHTYSKVTQFYPEAIKSPKQNYQYLQNHQLPQRVKGFCSPNVRQEGTKTAIPVTNGAYHINHQNNVAPFCPKSPIYTPQYDNKGGKIVIRQFNKLKPTKTASYLININNFNTHNQCANKENRNRQMKNTPDPLIYRNDMNQNFSRINLQHNQQNLSSINQDVKESDILSTLKSTKEPEGSRQIFKHRKRIQDFLKSKQQIKSIRDSDDISQQCSQVVATYDDLIKDGVLKMND